MIKLIENAEATAVSDEEKSLVEQSLKVWNRTTGDTRYPRWFESYQLFSGKTYAVVVGRN